MVGADTGATRILDGLKCLSPSFRPPETFLGTEQDSQRVPISVTIFVASEYDHLES